MSGTPGAGSYRAVLALPYAAPTFGAALIGRLSYGLLPLSLLLTVRSTTGSFALAGTAVALIGLTSLLLPLKSRLVDHYGQPRTLVPLALACGVALVAVPHLGARGSLVAATVAGLSAPPLGPAMRGTWHRLTEGTAMRGRAYALDSVGEESLYLVGPLLAGVIVATASARTALLVTAALMVVGTVLMVSTSPARHRASATGPRARWWDVGPLRTQRFLVVLVVLLLTGTSLSAVLTSVAARAQAAGEPGAAGYVETAIAAGSVLGGIAWGGRTHRATPLRHLATLCAVLAVGAGLAATSTTLVSLGVVLGLSGTAVAPLFVVGYLAADDLAQPDQRTEASTWINTVHNIGSALGAAGTGLVVDGLGAGAGFVGAAVVLGLTTLWCAVLLGRTNGNA